MLDSQTIQALTTLLNELLDGAQTDEAFILNRTDPGLLKSLDKLSAEAASQVGPQGGASIAAHADHVRYGLSLMNRWANGEQPFSEADWSASWKRIRVSESEWAERRQALKKEAHAWRQAIQQSRNVNQLEATGIVASVAHLAYHMGAIRQMDRSIRGPLETEIVPR